MVVFTAWTAFAKAGFFELANQKFPVPCRTGNHHNLLFNNHKNGLVDVGTGLEQGISETSLLSGDPQALAKSLPSAGIHIYASLNMRY